MNYEPQSDGNNSSGKMKTFGKDKEEITKNEKELTFDFRIILSKSLFRKKRCRGNRRDGKG